MTTISSWGAPRALARPKPLRAEYSQTKKGQWTYGIKSANGEIWLTPSEGFATKSNAKRSLRNLVKRLGGSMDNVVEIGL